MVIKQYPVCLYALDENDQAFHVKDALGRSPRFIIEQVTPIETPDRFFYPTRADAEEFMLLHGMERVSDAEMVQCRQAAKSTS